MSLLHPQSGRKPLVGFATTNRARLAGNNVGSTAESRGSSNKMPPVTRKKSAAAAKKRRARSSKVRFVNGRVQLRLAGYSGIKYLSPSHLVRHIPAARLRLAAKQVLKKMEHGNGKRKKNRKGNRDQKRGKKRSKEKQTKKKKQK